MRAAVDAESAPGCASRVAAGAVPVRHSRCHERSAAAWLVLRSFGNEFPKVAATMCDDLAVREKRFTRVKAGQRSPVRARAPARDSDGVHDPRIRSTVSAMTVPAAPLALPSGLRPSRNEQLPSKFGAQRWHLGGIFRCATRPLDPRRPVECGRQRHCPMRLLLLTFCCVSLTKRSEKAAHSAQTVRMRANHDTQYHTIRLLTSALPGGLVPKPGGL